ncbi:GIY-YIG nuclease family protein [Candidatus Saccharibacteria bacterium]|nr:GIY-YIG nuclease family protein [Candidatus Saccharibacteria bacterium]
MYFVYLMHIKKSKEFYIGSTPDLDKRFYSHNSSKSISTKSGVPWKLIYFEAYPTKEDVARRERRLKHYGQGLRRLKERITLVD